jgi:DNA-binding NarL/FixJ family response regulator
LTIRVALADDQAMVREGLKALLALLGMQVLVEASDGAELIQELRRASVDVIVSDIRMPGLNGIDAVRALRAAGDATPVVLLTTFDDDHLMLEAVNAGAQGFLLKGASTEDLRTAIERALLGQNWLAPTPTDSVHLVAHMAVPERPIDSKKFSDRELAVLRLLAGGYSNKEIARSLTLAQGTVKNHVSEILAKLETRDRTRAVLKAITLRII